MGMRIAMVGPWPPETSGIAGYAADLAGQLETLGADVTRVGDANDTAATLALLATHDVVVYQMGNHAGHHAWMLPLMARIPGVVHLHDMVLHHLVVMAMEHHGQLTSESYAEIQRGWYPPQMRRSAVAALESGLPIWAQESVVSMPLFEPVVRMATDVIVHSEFAAQALHASFPYLPVHVVPQCYTITSKRRPRKRLSTICVLGSGEPNRRFDWIAEALERIDRDLSFPLTLEIAGQLNPAVERDIERIARLGNIRLNLLGRMDDRSFDAEFSRADLLIAFRHPTMGETSAIVSKAFQHGLPTIVSDQGWYAELPACVHKIEANHGASAALSRFLRDHLSSPGAFAAWAEECHAVSERHVSGARQAARMYTGVLAAAVAAARLRSQVADHLAAWKLDPAGPLAKIVAGIDVHCSFLPRSTLAAVLSAATGDVGRGAEDEDEAIVLFEPLNDGDFRCHMEVNLENAEARPTDVLELLVHISNLSDVAYASPTSSQSPDLGIFIGYHWHKIDEDYMPEENPRIRLSKQITPGDSLSQTIRVRVPKDVGDYSLIVDLVQEQVAWFRHKEGRPAVLQVRVDEVERSSYLMDENAHAGLG